MTRILLILTLLASLAVGGYFLWQNNQVTAPEAAYRTQKIETGDLTQIVSANGTLNPVVLVSVGTQVSGTVKKLYVDYNDHVKAGQILAELDPPLFQAQVRQSRATLANAMASLELATANERRSRQLFQQHFIARQDLDLTIQAKKSARAQVDLAQAQLDKDLVNLSYSVIRSPVSGVVVDRQVDVGQTVAASFQTPTLFKIAEDLSRMQINSSFAEADIGAIKVGQAVHFSVDAFPDMQFVGTVKQLRLNATTLQNVVTYDVVVAVDNSSQLLKPGMTAYVNVITRERKGVLLLPNAALRFKPHQTEERKGGSHRAAASEVYLIRHHQLTAIAVKTGITDNKFTELLEGDLKAGDEVVTGEKSDRGGNSSAGTFRMRML
ncbi:efflux RND transporter periplasmic adaptor subunit [Mariprofundus erugo]|uniref:Efflux RND transporter periplasmic adaptor subunit n=1 Tax=Mariprofundus erugo TaxID=2528639 RepID=A0A5R9GPC4_9PROT|nr:efflux RND transporter periplasmic adaptor subunit [Mariprofundus erugo]TLS68151.1 efflux RND transporter periplasmic adaptor subunit [Mariprofundus erugo]